MAENLEQFCLADPLHFRALRDWCPEWDIGLAAGKNFDEEGWDVREFDVWRVYTPPGRVVVAQGWKIHVSATAESAGDALERIARICRAHEVAFKHLVTLAAVVASCSRSSARASAGKFIVLYPEDEAVFLEVVAECAEAVAGLAGPYVLTDRQWEPHSPVFFRYGAFQPQQVWTSSGTRAPARASADGLVPDERSVPYRTPIGVSVPEEIRRRSQPVALDAELPVRFVEAVQHSACGGVYRAVDRTTGRALIVKEARPHTGESPRLPSAIERLSHEARVLAETDGVHAPLLRHVFEVDGHRFLAIDEVLGQPLRGWVASRHPMLSSQPSSALVSYVRDARRVASGIRDALSAVHAAGWAHNDVHPGNVIVRDDLSVALIDFEFATALDDVRRPGMHCGGFARAGGPAVERDLFAVTMIEGWLMHPGLGAQLELLPEAGLALVDEARTWFGGRDEVATAVAAYVSHGYRAPVVERTGHRLTTPPSSPHRDQYISYLRSVASPERAVLFPGHATAYASPLDALALAHGTAGVLAALQTAGEPIDAEWGDHFRAAASAPVRTAGSPGLWDGWAGIAATMASLGDHAAARHAVGRVADALEGCTDPTLWSCLAWAVVGLSLTAEQTADRDAEELALSTLDRLAASPLLWQSRTSKPGLMHGPSGVAAVLASATGRFPDASGRELWLQAARELLTADVQRCAHVAGVRQIVDRGVALPYLGEGSLGVALARMALRHAEGSALTALDEELARSGMLELIVEPGLVYGRLGVQLAMSLLIDEKAPELSLSLRTWVARHGELLRSGRLGVDGGVAILGRGTGRICADLATGAAGALAVGAALDGTSLLLSSLLGLGLASRPLALVTPTGHRPV